MPVPALGGAGALGGPGHDVRNAGQDFLAKHFDDIGVKSTVDLSAETRAEWA